MDVEVVGSLTFGDDGKPGVNLSDAIVGDLGRSGGEDGLEDDLGIGVALAELLEGLRNVAENVRIAQSPFQIIYPRHDINGAGLCGGQIRRSQHHPPRRFPRNPLVQPHRRLRQPIARKPQAQRISQHHRHRTRRSTTDRLRLLRQQGAPLLIARLSRCIAPR